MRSLYLKTFFFICGVFLMAGTSLWACSCFPRNTFCELYQPVAWEDTRVYRGTILAYDNFELQPNGHVLPTMQVLISSILHGPDDLSSDTITLIGQDGLNCATPFPVIYDNEIIFLVTYLDMWEGSGLSSPHAELSGCGPSYLNYENGQVSGPIGADIPSGVSLAEFTAALDVMGNCALISDVDDHFSALQSLSVSPNPATDVINLRSTGPLNFAGRSELLNSQGRVVMSRDLLPGAADWTFSVAELPRGVYFVRTTAARASFTQKIVIR